MGHPEIQLRKFGGAEGCPTLGSFLPGLGR
jgi:hypothetical protein